MTGAIAKLLRHGVERHQAGDLDAARLAYSDVLRQRPEQPDALHLLGVLHDQQGDHATAIALIGQAIRNAPGQAAFHCNLGNALLALARRDDAAIAYRQAIAIDSQYAEAHYNLANLLRDRGESNEARRHFETALAIQPDHLQAQNNLAMLLWEDLDDEAAAQRHYDRLLSRAPEWATARMNYGLFRLACQDYVQGWREYEWRWRSDTYGERDWGLGLPRWDGRRLDGAALLVWGEQGVGDQILYGTMLRDVQQYSGARLVVAVDPRLVGLFARSLSRRGIAVVPRGLPVEASMQCPFGSLGAFLRHRAGDFTGRGAYLQADPARCHQLRSEYQKIAGQGRRLMGLSWRSINRSIGDRKSLTVECLLPVLRRPDIQWICLQYGDVEKELAFLRGEGIAVHQDGGIDGFRDMDAQAAQISALDGVLSVSNTVVHLAGALGVPCRMLLARGRGRLWYWPGQGDISLWYDSVRTHRQKRPGDWSGPLADLQKRPELLLS